MMNSSIRFVLPLLIAFPIAACAASSGSTGVAVQELASTMVAETAEAQMAAAHAETLAAAQSPTDPPPPATATPPPEPTATTGPLSLEDDFSSDTGYWDCDNCEIENGQLHFGPYPVSGALLQHFAICTPCGMVTTYYMSVDVTFGEGPSDRGYGILVRGREDYVLTYEVTPWQDFDFWRYESDDNEWTWVNGLWAGAVRAGRQTNRLEIEVSKAPNGATDIALTVNGKTPIVIFGQPGESGLVGLTLFGHAVDVYFDNFEFDTDEVPTYPSNYDFIDA